MKNLKLFPCFLAAALVSQFALADLAGPYTSDADTLFLFHFDEASGGTVASNAGSKGGVAYAVNENPASTTPPTDTTMLGATGYSSGAINFGNCMTNPTSVSSGGYEFGYDFNNSGAYDGDTGSTSLSADSLAMTNFNIGNGGQTPFTIEALIQPSTTAGSQEIVCTDNSQSANANRGFQFRINAGGFQFQFIGGSTPRAISGTIPTTGPDAFVAGAWYHVAATYDGATMRLYWTRVDPSVGAAHLLSSGAISLGTVEGAVSGPLIIGNENRNTAGEQFLGSIDEVRISSVCRAANQMQFFSPLVSITQDPVSQNIDYNQAVTFSVGASSLTSLGYQWRFNSNSIAGATNTSYVIPNVAAANGGYYDVIVTNTAGYAATSSPALLVVGAANFLNHRYSFTTDASDSVGHADGTLYGDANVTDGALVLDGTTGTYMQLPANLFTAANATALTVEFWATFGVNENFVRVFDFGNTNVQNNGVNYVGFSPHNDSGGNQIHISPGDGSFQQQVTAPGTFDGLTMHVACVIDPPNQTLAIYTNGVLEASITNMTVGIPNLNDTLSYIGHSLFAADPYLNASIDELRIYNGALAGLSIKQSDDQGPNTILADGPAKFVTQPADASVPVGQTATFSAAAVGYLPINYQWLKNGALIPGATNASYSFMVATGDNSSTFVAYATNTIGATTYVTNSSTAKLTVFQPPTLAWLDSANGGADSSWNTTSLNWNNIAGGGVIAFAQTNGVLFDSRGSGSSYVDIAQPVIPYNITVNAASDYAFASPENTGSLNGQGSLTKLNSGMLILDVTNNLTGATTISGGTLQVGNYDSFGSLGSGPVTNNGALSFDRSDAALNVANAIHGSGTLTFDGYGSVTVSGANDYTGSTFVNACILYLPSGSGLGAASSGTTVAAGGQIYITANVDAAEPLTLNGVGDGNGALRKGGAGLTTWNGPVTLASDSTLGIDSGATLTLSNAISGAAMLTASGGGTLALSTANTYSGGTMLSGPVINLNANGALGTGLITIGGAGRLVIGDGLNFTNAVLASAVSPGTATGLLMVNDNTNGAVTTISGPLEFDASPATGGDFMGPFSSGYLNVTGPIINTATGMVSSRDGRVRFSGGGNYTAFALNQGTVSIGANNGLCPNAALQIGASGAAVFDLNGFNQALTGLSDGATNPELVTNSAAAPGTLTLNLATDSFFSGTLAGNLAVVQNGSALLTLAGTNSYTGNTTVNGGILEIAVPTLAPTATVTVANGAVLQLDFSGTNQVAALVLNGVSQPLGVYNSTTSSTYITGAGSLLVASSVATSPVNITTKVSGDGLILSWPTDHIGWRLQVQTNALSVGLRTNWVDVPNSTMMNSVTNAINPANGSVFYRMVYP
jgi:autotransporter-associated beta strand protein